MAILDLLLIAYLRAQADVVVAVLCLLALVTGLHQRQVYLQYNMLMQWFTCKLAMSQRWVTQANLIIANMAR